MANNRILLLGGNGQIGQALRQAALPDHWHLGVFTRAECDFMKPGDIARAIRGFEPELVINAAAMTDIDACQRDPLRAIEINFHAVANIAAQCDTLSAPLIHLSTDYVFDGQRGQEGGNHPYKTTDAMNPVNKYGETKMMGEEAVRHGLHWHVILRTSLVFSSLGDNILTKTLRQIETQEVVEAVSDQTANPTSAAAVAEAVIAIGHAILQGKGNGFGTFHVSGDGPATRYEFLQAVMEAHAPFTEHRPRLDAVFAKDVPNRVPRPPYSVLDNTRLQEVYGLAPRSWRADLQQAVQQYAEGQRQS